MLKRSDLLSLYSSGSSMPDLAKQLQVSTHTIVYWMTKYGIPRRTWSEATYVKRNPNGDPFKVTVPTNLEEGILFGLGIGLYWGEGNKANPCSIRLGNTDPDLLNKYIDFLLKFFSVQRADLKFSIQVFTDIDIKGALDFWTKKLKICRQQFNKPIITISGSIGTYKKKSQYGVVTVMYHNKKMRDIMVSWLPK